MGDPLVTPNVARMTYHRLPYGDADSPREMSADCHEVEHNLGLGHPGMQSVATDFLGEGPVPASVRLRSEYDVPDDLARMVDGLELHFD